MISVCKRFRFDAAHKLPNHLGLCKNLHGHCFSLEVEITGIIHNKIGPEQGMIIDFSMLKTIVNDLIINQCDHSYLNDQFENPTVELMVGEFALRLKSIINNNGMYRLTRVRLYETEDSYAEWRDL